MKMIALVSQLAISMLTAMLICGGIGYAVDAYFHTNLLIWFLLFGVCSGYRTCYNVICKFLGKKSLFESKSSSADEKDEEGLGDKVKK